MQFRQIVLIATSVCILQPFGVEAGTSSFLVRNSAPHMDTVLHVTATSGSCMNSVSPRELALTYDQQQAEIQLDYDSTWYHCAFNDSTQNFEVHFLDQNKQPYSAAFNYVKTAGSGENLNITKDPANHLKIQYGDTMRIILCDPNDKLCY